jgi:ferric-dicitrate binding protein FerR (iron transport regulator)
MSASVFADFQDLSCQEARRLLVRMEVDDSSITNDEGEAFALHIANCQECAKAFYVAEGINEDGTFKSEDVARYARIEPSLMTIEEGWRDLLSRCPDLAQAYARDSKQLQLRRILRPISQVAALAACLALVVIGGWLTGRFKSVSPAVSQGHAEVVSGAGRQTVTMGQPLATKDQRQEILLGGMHRVVMNQNTSATFTTSSQDAYEIQLAQGELYVEVIPGHSFTVTTANARLSITGTQFDVKAQQDTTELTLLKGSVQFSALDLPAQAVSVMAGHVSEVIGKSAPTSPTVADAFATTAWARDTVLGNVVARVNSGSEAELWAIGQNLWRQPNPPALDTLTYENWRNEHQEWCFRQHPWMLKALEVLKARNIQADWIDVLMFSGEIWHFHYDPMLPPTQPLARLEPTAIVRLARHYGVDERELLHAVGLQNSKLIATFSIQGQTLASEYADALRGWHAALATDSLEKSQRNNVLQLFSLLASTYLANMRTAAYLWADAHPNEALQLLADITPRPTLSTFQPGTSEKDWLSQLRHHAITSRNAAQIAMEWLMVPDENVCAPQALEQQLKLVALVASLLKDPLGTSNLWEEKL